MTVRSSSWKVFASIALVAMTCAVLAGCGGGGGSRPTVSDGGDQMTILPRPPSQSALDLVVGSPSADDSVLETSAPFRLSATVSNDGDAEAPPTTLRYYRSTDATITTSDTEVGEDAVGVLAAAGTSAQSVSLAAPSTAGTYYYGACVDAVMDEADTTNNCSASVQVDVFEPQNSPDLSVVSPTVSNNAPEIGTNFDLSTTVTNQGDGESGSNDAAILPFDGSDNYDGGCPRRQHARGTTGRGRKPQ